MNNLNVIIFVVACAILSLLMAWISGMGFAAAFATTIIFGGGYAFGRLLTVLEYKKKFDDTIKSINGDA